MADYTEDQDTKLRHIDKLLTQLVVKCHKTLSPETPVPEVIQPSSQSLPNQDLPRDTRDVKPVDLGSDISVLRDCDAPGVEAGIHGALSPNGVSTSYPSPKEATSDERRPGSPPHPIGDAGRSPHGQDARRDYPSLQVRASNRTNYRTSIWQRILAWCGYQDHSGDSGTDRQHRSRNLGSGSAPLNGRTKP